MPTRQKIKLIFSLLVGLALTLTAGCGVSEATTSDETVATEDTLKELAADHGIRIGSNYDYALSGTTHDSIFAEEFNEYDIESNEAKFNGVKKLLQDLLDQGVPVHALGWQMHVRAGSFDPETLLTRMNEIADMGLDNYITELDVELPEDATSGDYEEQKQTYKTVIKVFLEAKRRQTLVFWGLRDGSPYWITNNHPLLFDESFEKKAAYFGVQEALLEKGQL